MFFSSKIILVFVVTDTACFIAAVERDNVSPKILASQTAKLPSGTLINGAIKDRKQFADALRTALKGMAQYGETIKEAVLVMPEPQVYLTALHFTEGKSIDDILKEAPKEALAAIPLDYRQLFCDFFLTRSVLTNQASSVQNQEASAQQSEHPQHTVLYAACDKSVATSYLEVLSELGIKPVRFVIEPEVLQAFYGISAQHEEPVLLVSLGENNSYIAFAENGVVIKVAPCPIFSFDLANKDCALKLQNEIETFLASYQAAESRAPAIAHIYVFTKTEKATPFEKLQFISRTLQEKLTIHAAPLVQEDKNISPFSYLALGASQLFFQKEKRSIDLLPRSFREQAAMLQLNTFLTSISIMFIIAASAFMSVFSYAWSEMYFERGRAMRESGSGEQNVASPRFQEIKSKTIAFNEEVDILSNIQLRLFKQSDIWTPLLDALRTDGITGTGMQFVPGELRIELAGFAEARNDLTVLKKKLEAMPFVVEVISPLSNLDRTTNISYSLTVKLDSKKLPYLTQ